MFIYWMTTPKISRLACQRKLRKSAENHILHTIYKNHKSHSRVKVSIYTSLAFIRVRWCWNSYFFLFACYLNLYIYNCSVNMQILILAIVGLYWCNTSSIRSGLTVFFCFVKHEDYNFVFVNSSNEYFNYYSKCGS